MGGKPYLRTSRMLVPFCNRYKGTYLGSISQRTGELTPFFNPRTHPWYEHFALEDATIVSLTEVGEVTARILGFNSIDRILERSLLVDIGRYPSPTALRRIRGSGSE